MNRCITELEKNRLCAMWGEEFFNSVYSDSLDLFGPDVGPLQIIVVAIGHVVKIIKTTEGDTDV